MTITNTKQTSEKMTTSSRRPNNGPIRKNSGTHVMLLVLKFYNRPASLNEIKEIAPKKVNSDNQRKIVDSLIARGLVREVSPGRYAITPAGVSMVYEIADRPQ